MGGTGFRRRSAGLAEACAGCPYLAGGYCSCLHSGRKYILHQRWQSGALMPAFRSGQRDLYAGNLYEGVQMAYLLD